MVVGFFKYLIVALVAFACYNEFVLMRREHVFNDIAYHDDKASVIDALGEPQHVYPCTTGGTPASFLLYIDNLCKDNVTEVDAFPLCRIPFRCLGWNYIAFDAKNKVIVKYRMAN